MHNFSSIYIIIYAEFHYELKFLDQITYSAEENSFEESYKQFMNLS